MFFLYLLLRFINYYIKSYFIRIQFVNIKTLNSFNKDYNIIMNLTKHSRNFILVASNNAGNFILVTFFDLGNFNLVALIEINKFTKDILKLHDFILTKFDFKALLSNYETNVNINSMDSSYCSYDSNFK